VGSFAAALGFFFLPLIELKPNRIASGIPFNLLELQGDYRYMLLFILTLVPVALAFRKDELSRGWLLALVGNFILILTLYLPAAAGERLLADAEALFEEGVALRSPRVLPSAALALGLLGSYVVLFAGAIDLRRMKAGRFSLLMASWSGTLIVLWMGLSGTFDVYSVVVEYHANGAVLAERFVEHITFVSIALLTGCVAGLMLGLWASRDERVAPIILYPVGIIQTIPSLALFGLLLFPLARFGDQNFLAILQIFAISLVIAVALVVLYNLLANRLVSPFRPALLVISAVAMAVPIALFVIVFVSFTFRITFLAITDGRFAGSNTLLLLGLLAAVLLWTLTRARFVKETARRYLRRLTVLLLAASGLILLAVLAQSAQIFLRGVAFDALTLRQLGVSGIGVAPALIALTLYSLLPLVRNTYAGLNNVDPAIIDSGRGMGMTPSQIFFRIELPLAFPVIMAGVRNAGIALIGIGTIAAVIGGGGLGDFVLQGIVNTSIDLILLGAIPAILLAMLLDSGLRLIEALLTSPGIRQTGE
jgi:ABC-type proline/glycine betaine transport system permease subunit